MVSIFSRIKSATSSTAFGSLMNHPCRCVLDSHSKPLYQINYPYEIDHEGRLKVQTSFPRNYAYLIMPP
jgi:hypothetical protein